MAVLLCTLPALASEPQTGPPDGIQPAGISLKQLLKQHARAEGSLRAGLPDGRKETWSISVGSMSGTVRYAAQGSNYREDELLGPDRTAEGRLGATVWHLNANGQISFGAGIHRSDVVDALAVQAQTDVTLLGRVRTPVDAYVVRVDPPGGRLEYQFYDSKTFLLDRVEELRSGRRVTTTFDDYRTSEGVKVPWHIHTSDGFATNDGNRTVTALQVGVRLTPSDLAVPRPDAPLLTVSGNGATVPILTSGDNIVIPVKLSGHTVDFLLDSGADGIVIDNAAVEALGIKEYGRITSETAGVFLESSVVLPRLSAGPLTLANVHARALPFTQWTDAGAPIAGLLGYDFIRDVVWHIDYRHGTLEALDPATFSAPKGARAFPITFDDNVPTIGAVIGGVNAQTLVIDTGAYRSVLFSRYVTAHGSRLGDKGLGEAMTDSFPFVNDFVGVGGSVEYRPLQVGPVALGGWSFPTWLFDVTQNAAAFEFEDYDGLIGQDFLRNFDVYLDYPNAKVYLVPNDRFYDRWPSAQGASKQRNVRAVG